MPAYACPCGVTQAATDDPAGPRDADGGLAMCHTCNERVQLVAP